MRIRLKTITVLGITLLVLILFLYHISNAILISSINRQEAQSTLSYVERVEKMISLEYLSLKSTSGDWANWVPNSKVIDRVDTYCRGSFISS